MDLPPGRQSLGFTFWFLLQAHAAVEDGALAPSSTPPSPSPPQRRGRIGTSRADDVSCYENKTEPEIRSALSFTNTTFLILPTEWVATGVERA